MNKSLKLLVTILIFLFCINVFIISSFAFEATYEGDTYTLPDEYFQYGKDVLIFYNRVSEYVPNSGVVVMIGNGFYSTGASGVSGMSSDNPLYFYYYKCGSDYKGALKNLSKFSLSSFTKKTAGFADAFIYFRSRASLIYSNFDFKNSSGDIVFSANAKPQFNAPSFMNTEEELASGKFDTLKIDAGDLDKASDEIGLAIFDITSNIIEVGGVGFPNFKPVTSFVLNSKSEFAYIADLNIYYNIPQSRLGIDLSNDKKYMFCLFNMEDETLYNSVIFTIGGLTTGEEIKNAQDVTNDKLDEQTNAIKEQTETNKNIFEKIGEVLSYINPFSENFFVYKLLELLGEMLKSLFVPSEDFLSNWFTDVSSYFEDAFGILYYPVDLVIQVLGRFDGIVEQDPVISFGDLSLFGFVVIHSYSFNFNSLLSNDVLKMLHDFYLIVIDVILWFGLLVYCKNVVANIFGGKFTDDVIDEVQDPGGYNRTAKNISRYNYAKQSNLKANGKMKGQ